MRRPHHEGSSHGDSLCSLCVPRTPVGVWRHGGAGRAVEFRIGVCDNLGHSLEAQAHLVERLECFHGQVRSLWGDGVAAASELTLEDSPGAGSPTLVVWAFADMAPEEDAEGTSALFRGQYDRFGPWPSGIGFALVIRDAAEVR